MSRLRADLLLLLTALIWGGAFVAQKTGMAGLGPFGFVAARFILSFIIVLPFALRESRAKPKLTPRDRIQALILCVVFVAGVLLQQAGLLTATVTNAGFLTSLYVVMVPFIGWFLFGRRPGPVIAPACLLALAGIWLLNGASLAAFRAGDWMMLGCAVCFAVQVPLLGVLVQRTGRPLAFVVLQYVACVAVALPVAGLAGDFSIAALRADLWPVLYAGLFSGGIAYTIQAVAQQYTPSSDAAIIMGGESLFAALFGALLLHERLDGMGWAGCGLILLAIGLVETGALITGRNKGTL